jgi:exopolysaccharide biosynthesis polyprenyl glycosylphosphotransferase
MNQCLNLGVDFYIVPDMYDIVAGHLKTNQIYGFPLVRLFPSPLSPLEEKVKRLIDVFFSFLILFFSFPITAWVFLLIKLDSPGQGFFKQERVGKDGALFYVYKFRSMVVDAEKHTGPVWAQKNDNRITRVGRIIRKIRIDEIPQFYNVLKGEMSIVGPRPERQFFVEKFKKQIPLYANRLRVKPGLTGYAQVKHKYDSSLEDVKEKLKYDLFYIENISLRLDLKIMFRTIFVVLFPGDKAH